MYNEQSSLLAATYFRPRQFVGCGLCRGRSWSRLTKLRFCLMSRTVLCPSRSVIRASLVSYHRLLKRLTPLRVVRFVQLEALVCPALRRKLRRAPPNSRSGGKPPETPRTADCVRLPALSVPQRENAAKKQAEASACAAELAFRGTSPPNPPERRTASAFPPFRSPKGKRSKETKREVPRNKSRDLKSAI